MLSHSDRAIIRRDVPQGSSMKELFQIQDTLYQCGARNFMFIDLPPNNGSSFSSFFFSLYNTFIKLREHFQRTGRSN
jgi:hypothetical protein